MVGPQFERFNIVRTNGRAILIKRYFHEDTAVQTVGRGGRRAGLSRAGCAVEGDSTGLEAARRVFLPMASFFLPSVVRSVCYIFIEHADRT